jgi:hypothetical protein
MRTTKCPLCGKTNEVGPATEMKPGERTRIPRSTAFQQPTSWICAYDANGSKEECTESASLYFGSGAGGASSLAPIRSTPFLHR